jgi:hypothetical protein
MNTCLHRLMDVIDTAGLTPPDFAEDGFALFATAISKLPPAERERVLQEIECGALRDAVKRFDVPRYPQTNGTGKGGGMQ